jgi:hypothetical protein
MAAYSLSIYKVAPADEPMPELEERQAFVGHRALKDDPR